MPKLTLYHFESCPYCVIVRKFMAENNISIPMKDTQKDHRAQAELIKIGGKRQVPCLVIDGKALYESDDIIAWLKNHYKK